MTTDADPHCRIGKVTWHIERLDRMEAEIDMHRLHPAPEMPTAAKSPYDDEPSHYDRNGYCDNPNRGY